MGLDNSNKGVNMLFEELLITSEVSAGATDLR